LKKFCFYIFDPCIFRKDKNTPKLSALFLAESCPISFPGTSLCQHQNVMQQSICNSLKEILIWIVDVPAPSSRDVEALRFEERLDRSQQN
jgi:hypothetical protein